MAQDTIDFDLPIEADHVARFAAAVGAEQDPIFSDPQAAQELGLPGPVAPPTFGVTQIFHVPRGERESRLGANLDYGRVLHGEQEFLIKRLPLVGETLRGEMRIAKDFTKEGKRGGSMRFVTYETRFTDADGDEVMTALYTLIETAKDVG